MQDHNSNQNNDDPGSLFFNGFNIPPDDQIKTACVQFEDLIGKGSQPDIEKFLQDTDRPSRTKLLTRLILIEVRHRIMHGDTPSLEEYIKRFPDEAETINSLKSYFDKITLELASASAVTIKATTDLFKQLSRFELRREIGSGSFGNVWLAWDCKLKRYVAVKTFEKNTFNDNEIDPVLHEAVCSAQLKHKNIVALYDYGTEGEHGYLVMEYIAGGDLKALIKSGKLNIRLVAELCMKIARALDSAHNAPEPVIHRDIKPSNILLDIDGEPKITDFGIAKCTAVNKTISKDQKILGTPVYMAPEQIRNTNVGPWSDVYSLGIVLYEMLAGKPPFEGDIRELIVSVQYRDMPDIRNIRKDVPKDLETICLKATAKLKKDRYQTAEDFANDLQLFLAGKPINAKPITFIQKQWRYFKNNKTPIMSITLALLLFYTTLIMAYAPEPPEPGKIRVDFDSEPTNAQILIFPVDPETNKIQIANGQDLNVNTPASIDLPPGKYAFFSEASTGQDKLTGFAYRMVPDIHNPHLKMPYNLTYYTKINNHEIKLNRLLLSNMQDPEKFIEVCLSAFAGNDEVIKFSKKFPNYEIEKRFWISIDVMRYADFFKLRRKQLSFNSPEYKNCSPEDPMLKTHVEASHWAEEFGCRLPMLEEYLAAHIFIKLSNNKYLNLYESTDNIQWSLTKLHNTLVQDKPIKSAIVNHVYSYYYLIDAKNDNYDIFDKDVEVLHAFRLVKDISSMIGYMKQ